METWRLIKHFLHSLDYPDQQGIPLLCFVYGLGNQSDDLDDETEYIIMTIFIQFHSCLLTDCEDPLIMDEALIDMISNINLDFGFLFDCRPMMVLTSICLNLFLIDKYS